MITIDQIISSNLEMLKEQEVSLQKSLDFVQKAIELFESQSNSSDEEKQGIKRGPKPKSSNRGTRKGRASNSNSTPSNRQGTHLDRVINLIKEKDAPMSSGELIDALFGQQTGYADRKQFSKIIYPTLTKAYRSRLLKLKKGKIYLR